MPKKGKKNFELIHEHIFETEIDVFRMGASICTMIMMQMDDYAAFRPYAPSSFQRIEAAHFGSFI